MTPPPASQSPSFLEALTNTDLTLDDDTCTFSIYSRHGQSGAIADELQSFWSSTYFNHDPFKPSFLWHSGYPPSLKSSDDSQLGGSLHYADSLEDEWFLVWCLLEISLKFDCEIQVRDNDGEFLLIEVADELPKWVTPDLAEGRVWIKAGSLHLIPLEATEPPLGGKLPTQDALKLLRSGSAASAASEKLNLALMARIRASSPAQLSRNHLFNTVAYLHPDIARALDNDHNLIGLAVKAFCDKDADSFKACRQMIQFPPQTPHDPQSDNLNLPQAATRTVPCLVRMTRPLYAIIMNQELNFHPPKPFERVRWMACDIGNTREWKRRALGMKICCGFEMMLFTADLCDSSSSNFKARSQRYQAYLQKLSKCDYFRGELEGSQKWNELESVARAAYLRSQKPIEALPRFQTALEKSALSPQVVSSSASVEGESDEWLNLDEEKLKAFFQDTRPGPLPPNATELSATEEERLARADVETMTSFADKVEKFIDGQGSLEGALHSDDELSDDSDESESEDSEQEALRADIFPTANRGVKRSHQTATATRPRKDAETQKRMEAIVPGLSDAEWGQKAHASTSATATGDPANHRLFAKLKEKPTGNDCAVPIVTETVQAGALTKKPMSHFSRESYDGVCEESSEEDGDSDDLNLEHDTMDKKAKTEIINDVDMDEERDDFLKFAREALGLSEEQYETILDSRRQRGAYVPPVPVASHETDDDDDDGDLPPCHTGSSKKRSMSSSKEQENGTRQVHFSTPISHPPSSHDASTSYAANDTPRNANLDTFDSLMNRMDAELQRQTKHTSHQCKKGGPIAPMSLGPDLGERSGTQDAEDLSDSDSEPTLAQVDEAMQSELAELMKQAGVDMEGGEEGQIDYGLIGHFLESFRSQTGLPGPVGNMAGRIGVDLLGQDKDE